MTDEQPATAGISVLPTAEGACWASDTMKVQRFARLDGTDHHASIQVLTPAGR